MKSGGQLQRLLLSQVARLWCLLGLHLLQFRDRLFMLLALFGRNPKDQRSVQPCYEEAEEGCKAGKGEGIGYCFEK